MDTQNIREVVVSELGIQSLPPEAQNEIIEGVSRNVIKHVFIEILARLPEDAQEEFKALVEAEKGIEAEAVAAKHIPDVPGFILAESKKAIEEFKRLAHG